MVWDRGMKLEEKGLACEPPACRARSQCSNPSGRENVLNQSPSLKVTLSASLLLSTSIISPSHILHPVLSTLYSLVPALDTASSLFIWFLHPCHDRFFYPSLFLALSLSITASLALLLLVTWYWSSTPPPSFLGHHASFQLKATYKSVCL